MRRLLGVLCGVWLAALPILTAQRVAVFHSPLTLWADAVQVNPDLVRPRLNYADALWKAGREQETTDQLLIAATHLPLAPMSQSRKKGYAFLVNIELGNLAMRAGHMEEGQMYYMLATFGNPEVAAALKR